MWRGFIIVMMLKEGEKREGLGNWVVGERGVGNGFGGEGTIGGVILRESRISGRKGGIENEGFGTRSERTYV